MLKINHIAKTFNPGTITEKKALVDVDIHLQPGDFVTVIGGNGAGKSTMLNSVAGAYPVDEGKIIIGGKSQLKHATTALLESFTSKKIVILSDDEVEASVSRGMIRIYEYSKESHA